MTLRTLPLCAAVTPSRRPRARPARRTRRQLGDGFAVSDDPQVARPGLQPVKRCLDVGRRPLARPAFTDPLNLARGLQRMKPPERLLVVESRRLGDLPDRMRLPRQLAKRPPQSILAWRRPQLGGGRLWLQDGRSNRLMSRWHRRSRPVPRPTRSAHHHRPLTFSADNFELTPAAARAANGAPTSGELDLGHVFTGWHTPLNIDGPPSRQSCARGSGYRSRSCVENKDFSSTPSVRLNRGREKTGEPPSPRRDRSCSLALLVGERRERRGGNQQQNRDRDKRPTGAHGPDGRYPGAAW